MAGIAAIQSEGDFEVVLLHETQSVLSDIISPELYSLPGSPPAQALFHSHSSFNMFLVLLVEFFADGTRSAFINEKFQNWSLFKGLQWFCDIYQDETKKSGLAAAVTNFEVWIAKVVPFQFWCPAVLNSKIEFSLKNEQLISFGANTAKHHLLRLSDLLCKLEALCVRVGYSFSPQEIAVLLASMNEEVRSRLYYHSSYLLELLGHIFLSLNTIIKARYAVTRTNRVDGMIMPAGITSDVFKDLYGSVLVFKRYEEFRILSSTPVTSSNLRSLYS